MDPQGLWIGPTARAIYFAWRLMRAVMGKGDPTLPPSSNRPGQVDEPIPMPPTTNQPHIPPRPPLPDNIIKLPGVGAEPGVDDDCASPSSPPMPGWGSPGPVDDDILDKFCQQNPLAPNCL